MRFLRFFIFLLFPCLLAAQAPSFLHQGQEKEIVVNNRVIAKVNGKPITMLDLVKKMDMVFYKEYPQYVGNPEARYQFYTMSWRHVLNDLIERDLILADAEEMKMPISNGDVRLELEDLFGPNVISNLDRAGLSMDEATKMLKDDIIIRRMMYMRINMKALKQVTPQDVREAYKKLIENYKPADEWTYQVISIRDADPDQVKTLSEKIYALLMEEEIPLTDLQERARVLPEYNPFTSIKVSEELKHKESEISPAYYEILSTIEPGAYSTPIEQRKGTEAPLAYRIFFLKDHQVDEYPKFQDLAQRLKNELLKKESEAENARYFARLREKYSVKEDQVDELIASGYEPFVLKPKSK